MKYNPALDGIRALAILAVLAVHTDVPGMEMGRWGVDVFFVLSGFLITSLLNDQAAHGGIRLGAFYLRRVRRLYPALLVMLGLYVLIAPWLYAGHQWRDAGLAALYLTDYAVAFSHATTWEVDPAISHTWSLSVEEHFYLLWPLVVMGLAKIRTRRFVVYLLASAYIAATAWRLHSHLSLGWWQTSYRFDTRISGLILGAMLAYLPELRHRAWGLAVPVMVAATWFATRDWAHSLSIIPAEWTGLVLVLWALSGQAKALTLPPLVYLGRISYGVYLFHWPVACIFRAWNAPWWQLLPLTALISIPLAHYCHKYVEARFMRQGYAKAEVGGVKFAV